MKKISINLLKVGLLLILGLCMFSVGNEVSAAETVTSYQNNNILFSLAKKSANDRKLAIVSCWVKDAKGKNIATYNGDGNCDNTSTGCKNDIKSDDITFENAGTLKVNKTNGKYYDGIKIKFAKSGSYTVKIRRRSS